MDVSDEEKKADRLWKVRPVQGTQRVGEVG